MGRKISIQCPSCLARIKASTKLIGQMKECPGCGQSFVIPDPTAIENKPTNAAEPVLISQADTVDMRLEWGEIKSNQTTSLEDLEAHGVRVRDLVVQYYRIIGGNDKNKK